MDSKCLDESFTLRGKFAARVERQCERDGIVGLAVSSYETSNFAKTQRNHYETGFPIAEPARQVAAQLVLLCAGGWLSPRTPARQTLPTKCVKKCSDRISHIGSDPALHRQQEANWFSDG